MDFITKNFKDEQTRILGNFRKPNHRIVQIFTVFLHEDFVFLEHLAKFNLRDGCLCRME